MNQTTNDKKDYLAPYENMKRVARENRIHKTQGDSRLMDIIFTISIVVLAVIVVLAIVLPYYLL
jgi:hypothetical protein